MLLYTILLELQEAIVDAEITLVNNICDYTQTTMAALQLAVNAAKMSGVGTPAQQIAVALMALNVAKSNLRLRGNINNDGVIDADDLLEKQVFTRYIQGDTSVDVLAIYRLEVLDMNGDGIFSSKDLVLLQRMINGTITSFMPPYMG